MKPTKEEAQEWKQELLDHAEEKILDLTNSDKFKNYLDTMEKFHSYSERNVNLIYSQNPNATHVAGFKQWQNDFERHVNKGAKSIRIAAPIIKKLTDEQKERFNTTEEKGIVGYRYIPVFDISQTSGKDIPSTHDFITENLADHENVDKLYSEMKDYINKNTSLSVQEDSLQRQTKGYFIPKTNEIVINNQEPDSALKLKTLYHEYAHSQLHGLEAEFANRPQEHKEAQAEAVAYVAMKNIGVNTDNYSLGYVATWAKDQNVIHQALSEIKTVSNNTIELTDVLTNKLGLQEELGQKLENMPTKQLNSQYTHIENEVEKRENGKTKSTPNNSDTTLKNLKSSLDKIGNEIQKRVEKDLSKYEKNNPEIRPEVKKEQGQKIS
ncbi:MAG: ssDNA-binding domain-containing protein [Tetragenococcus koreensis]|nr:ssDNA-binding domain-containing protein [Tetragenococcus koreensis]MDN6195172.1 ssDNA-binding domain-containing protein [Atopostipes suicloacalis]MDN6496994.1 ssDNA-binding domain-containing protein [Tetragenococcus koreensis]MDN6501809.1 ssDNA-binding domain-containing protein [Tetragenococcus koreensis]